MSIQILDASALDLVAGGADVGPVTYILGGGYVTQGFTVLIRTLERLAPGGVDDGTWAQIGASGLTA